ncbi:hypothetical protein D3870_00320 [Noviherbaspirillum cavernae]|uniref:Lipopolysaccharide biosynthesis protein n=1 Tax=Noviherbaspirillum cavernae TaxID=2320862 RepID=A0A418WWP7_9BURK|nr:hypothetical protein D3870_00320 [Noviherbaspirillum cavernae]
MFGTSLAVLGSIAGWRYEQAVIGEAVDKFADDLVVLAGLLALSLALLLPFIRPVILPWLHAPSYISEAVTWLAPALVAYVMGQALTNWLVRKGGFRITSASKIIQASTVLAVSLCATGSIQGLTVASMGGYAAACVVLLIGAHRMGWLRDTVRPKDLLHVIRRHVKFPLAGALPALFDSLSMLLPVYWVAIYFSANDTGQFGLSRQVLAAPLGMISVVVSQLLMKRFADAKFANASMLPYLKKTCLVMFGPILVLGLIVSFAASDIFAWLFGNGWRNAGAISQWMVWAYIAPMLVSPLSGIMLVLRRVGSNGAWQILHCAGLLSIMSLMTFSSIEQFIRMLVFFEIFSYAIYAALIAYALHDYEKARRVNVN